MSCVWWAILGLCWGVLTLCWGCVVPSWSHVGTKNIIRTLSLLLLLLLSLLGVNIFGWAEYGVHVCFMFGRWMVLNVRMVLDVSFIGFMLPGLGWLPIMGFGFTIFLDLVGKCLKKWSLDLQIIQSSGVWICNSQWRGFEPQHFDLLRLNRDSQWWKACGLKKREDKMTWWYKMMQDWNESFNKTTMNVN